MIYLTFTNGYSGVFRSQVLDTAEFLRARFRVDVRVVSIVSIRDFIRERDRLRKASARVTLLPMFPGVRNWRRNAHMLSVLARQWDDRTILGRSEFATALGVDLRSRGVVDRVGFDGRSARTAESSEYDSARKPSFSPEEIFRIERLSVLESDYRLAVSEQLVRYWREEFDYRGSAHVVIPCTLPARLEGLRSPMTRESLGLSPDQIVLVYSGSAAAWQSLDLMDRFVCEQMSADRRVVLLLLSEVESNQLEVGRRYADRVVQRWLPPEQVAAALRVADHGLLLREPSRTNAVSCPTKFAEYLDAGLGAIISEGVGDLSRFVRDRDCGTVVESPDVPVELARPSVVRRRRHMQLARDYFSKSAHEASYESLLENLGVLDPEAVNRLGGER